MNIIKNHPCIVKNGQPVPWYNKHNFEHKLKAREGQKILVSVATYRRDASWPQYKYLVGHLIKDWLVDRRGFTLCQGIDFVEENFNKRRHKVRNLDGSITVTEKVFSISKEHTNRDQLMHIIENMIALINGIDPDFSISAYHDWMNLYKDCHAGGEER